MNKLENEQMRAAGYGAPPKSEEKALCQICGEPMPPGEEMFNYHGYSCDCPKPPLVRPKQAGALLEELALAIFPNLPTVSFDKEREVKDGMREIIKRYLP